MSSQVYEEVVKEFEIPEPNVFRLYQTWFGDLREVQVGEKMLLYMLLVSERDVMYGLCIGFRADDKDPNEKPGMEINVIVIPRPMRELISDLVLKCLEEYGIERVAFFE